MNSFTIEDQSKSKITSTSNGDIIIVPENTDDIDYSDEELEIDQQFTTPLELNAYEQVKLFLTDAKNFFTSDLIENVAQILLSKHVLDSDDITKTSNDIAMSFARICDNISNIEEQFGPITHKTTLDKIIIETIKKVSNRIMTDEVPFSNFLFKSVLNEVSTQPEFYAELNIDHDLIETFKDLCTSNIELKSDYVHSIKNTIDSKLKILDVIQSVQQFTKFISRDASRFNTMEEFLNGFYEVLNTTSANISRAVEDESEGITLNSVLDKSFYKTVIRTRDDHIKCGMNIFDSITNGGFERDRVYLLSAKTGGGKSTVLLNIGYGMYKIGNGMFLPEISILNKMAENDDNIALFDNYCKVNIENIKKFESANHPNDKEYANKKHLLLYITLENTEYETMKRYMGRMGLFTNIFWSLIERDEVLKRCVNGSDGFNFTEENLPQSMNPRLKRKLIAISSYIRILNKYSRTEFKVLWKQPYSINAFDILAEIKKNERNGYIVDAVFVDYPDKLKAIHADNTIVRGEQSWDTLGKVIDNLKGLAKQAHVPVIGVSQLTREGNKVSGNRNLLIKGGNTAGSQQKESNTDTLINMNIHSKEDSELSARVDLFNNYQRILNQNKLSVANDIFSTYSNAGNGFNFDSVKDLMVQADRSTDILQIAFNMPDIQTITNYIVKNRDGISDITFETYIVYGVYLVTDYAEEALTASEYTIDTYSLIVEYMYKNNMLGQSALQVSNGMMQYFQNKQIEFRNSISDSVRSGNVNRFNPNGNYGRTTNTQQRQSSTYNFQTQLLPNPGI